MRIFYVHTLIHAHAHIYICIYIYIYTYIYVHIYTCVLPRIETVVLVGGLELQVQFWKVTR